MTTAPSLPPLRADSLPLPSNIWAPSPDASIEIYWSDPVDGAFDVALLLIDRAISSMDPVNLIARSILDSTTPRLTFSLVDPYSNNRILWGRIERRVDADGCIGVWLVDTGYPGGFTDLARIAGPFEGGAHGDAGH
ncbi:MULTISPECIES: hypothetical protein [Stenotrophomonas]|uniref:Uncharacterized protein n=1 Tax=Stenotrophomonas maltophilia TaxID=40324 RepID=A0A2J0T1M8_STEMA|nr:MULTISPECIES: hypothetical protein [Stenotrophomonas]MBA0309987.1 hypothetical protein [Stenotrophomonas maltophilia]MBH1863621.1 hypothetical protein [Stenotrophomonas maltophilia]MDH1388024.1 hypothetical protein [Stenotrophomonas sp. GD03701]MDH1391732.1 hypothetical protein [Stenotrophomonas sp. GD03702]PJL04272.1 hypothetical protein B9Y57_10315 [Stenotrophomonas maltophilia]